MLSGACNRLLNNSKLLLRSSTFMSQQQCDIRHTFAANYQQTSSLYSNQLTRAFSTSEEDKVLIAEQWNYDKNFSIADIFGAGENDDLEGDAGIGTQDHFYEIGYDKEMAHDEYTDPTKPRVYRYHRKRNPFFKVGYNPNHIPNPKVKDRKPRLPYWDNPIANWPPRVPRPTMHKNKTLLRHLESDLRKKIKTGREFYIPDFRAGDVLKVTKFHSISEGKFDEFIGVCIGKYQYNTLNAGFALSLNIENDPIMLRFKLYSPLIAKVEILRYGSNRNRAKLNYLLDPYIEKGVLLDPVAHGIGYKRRDEKIEQTKKNRKGQKGGDGDHASPKKVKSKSIKYDRPQI